MGILKLYSSGSAVRENTAKPDITKCRVLRSEVRGLCTIAEIEYDDFQNFDGRKLMVFVGETIDISRGVDPHFFPCASSPIARFRPTGDGWKLARTVADAYAE